jgi:hypothetical protein
MYSGHDAGRVQNMNFYTEEHLNYNLISAALQEYQASRHY